MKLQNLLGRFLFGVVAGIFSFCQMASAETLLERGAYLMNGIVAPGF